MAYHRYLYLLLASEILMVVHLARHEGINAGIHCVVKKERTRATADCHGAYRAAQQLICLHTLYAEHTLKQDDEVVGSKRFGETAYNARTILNTVHLLRTHEAHVRKPHLLGYLVVDTALRIVHIGMEREDDDALRKCLHHATLHIVLTSEARELVEDERMVRHYEVAALLGSLVDDTFSNVQTQ